ncbi:MAG: branched-chain amino acid ABC transporter permease, partial [Rhodospirillales bacterium]
VQGLFFDKPDPIFAGLSVDHSLYLVTWLVFAVLMAGAWMLLHSRSGRAIMAIRDNPIAASTMGINLALYKTTTFGISAMLAGVGGAN